MQRVFILLTVCLALCVAVSAQESNEMILVEGGSFTMGNDGEKVNAYEKPAHEVTVSSFSMSKYEITQKEWANVMGNNPSKLQGDDLPVYNVSWYAAIEYCNKRSEKEGLKPVYSISGKNVTADWAANGYRLPTEAEWEYAARGGKTPLNATYSGSDDANAVAWYKDNSNNTIQTVGKKQPNGLGIYDMSGNIREWVWDWRDYYVADAQTDPVGPASGTVRTIRGGSTSSDKVSLRLTSRDNRPPDSAVPGFRVVRRAESK